MKQLIRPLLIVGLYVTTCSLSCEKKVDSNGLPLATQEGKNTLGFLLNGQPWTPKGNNGTSNLDLYYDAAFEAGVFNVKSYRIINGIAQSFHMWGDSIQSPQKITLPYDTKFGFSFWDEEQNDCVYTNNDSLTTLVSGYFDLKKLDKVNGIFAGEFELHFKRVGCTDMNITQGRFDLKF